MPISNTSGVAGTVDLGGQRQGKDPLEGFAETLLRAQTIKRQSQMADLEAAMRIAPFDPESAKKLAGSLVKPEVWMNLQTAYKEKQATEKSQSEAQIAQLAAATEASKATTRTQGILATGEEQRQKQTENIDKARQMVSDPKATLEQKDQALSYLVAQGDLKADAYSLVSMTPAERKKFTDLGLEKQVDEARLAHAQHAAIAWGLDLTDAERTQYQNTGELPTRKVSTPASRAEERDQRRVAALEKQASAAMKEATAISLDHVSSALQKLREPGNQDRFKDIVSGLDQLATQKRSKLPVDEGLQQRMMDALAGEFGLQPVETKSLFGLWSNREYQPITGKKDIGTTGETIGATSPGQTAPTDTGAGFLSPETLRNLPGEVAFESLALPVETAVKGMEMVGKGADATEEFINTLITGKTREQKAAEEKAKGKKKK